MPTHIIEGDSRLTDARTPAAHAASHKSGGSDAIALDTLAAPTDITTLNSTTSQHGLLPKLGGGTANYLRADGTWATPGASLPDLVPQDQTPGSQTIADQQTVVTYGFVSLASAAALTLAGSSMLRIL